MGDSKVLFPHAILHPLKADVLLVCSVLGYVLDDMFPVSNLTFCLAYRRKTTCWTA